MKKKFWFALITVILILLIAFGIYVSDYYHADAMAEAALQSDETMAVIRTEYG